MCTHPDNSVKTFIEQWSNDLGRRGGPEKESHSVKCAAIRCDPVLLTCLHLVTSAQSERWASAEIISSLCQKAKRWIGYLRKGISPLCKLWIIHCNTRGCHTLVPLTFLYLTVKKLFFPFILSPCLCNYHVPISPCPHSHPQYPEGSQSFFLWSNYLPYLFETKSLV